MFSSINPSSSVILSKFLVKRFTFHPLISNSTLALAPGFSTAIWVWPVTYSIPELSILTPVNFPSLIDGVNLANLPGPVITKFGGET